MEQEQPAVAGQVERTVRPLIGCVQHDCAACKAAERYGKWIPVSERMPRSDRMVLIMYRSAPRNDKNGKPSQHLARYAGGQWRFLVPRDKTKLPERVTHWMPLPKFAAA